MRKYLFLSNQSGFALALFLILLPMILAVIISTLSLIHLLQLDRRMLYECRQIHLSALSRVAKNLNQLLSFNPKAKALSASRLKAEKAYKMAVISGSPEVIAATRARLELVKFRQLVLDTQQQKLIADSKRILFQKYYESQSNLKKIFKEHSQILSTIAHYTWIHQSGKKAVFHVIRQTSDIAPEYRTSSLFKEDTSMAQYWHFQLSILSSLKSFLSYSAQFQRQCEVGLNLRNEKWIEQIILK